MEIIKYFTSKHNSLKLVSSIAYVVQFACLTHCIMEYVADFSVCRGHAMEPTLSTEDVLLTEHVTPRLQMLERGDIVLAKSPSNPKKIICKRVIGLPGDRMKLGIKYVVVPNGYVWLEGDNHIDATDSRHYGPIPQGLIRSRALCKVWPFHEAKMLTMKARYFGVK